MIGLLRLARPLVRVPEGGKVSPKVVKMRLPQPKSLRSVYSKRSSHVNFKRYYTSGKPNGEAEAGPIMTVDKWGVQREASEVTKSNPGKTSYTSGAPATEMPVFEVSRLNFQETLQSQAPVIIMAYLPRYV
jgi:hypothetical protein